MDKIMGYEYAEVPADAIAMIDSLVEMGRKVSPHGRVETDYDWQVVKRLWVYYTKAQPQDYKEWQSTIARYREAYKDNKFQVKEEGGGFMKHTLELPLYFYRALKSFFPNQMVEDKKFTRKFIDVIPDARMSAKHHKI